MMPYSYIEPVEYLECKYFVTKTPSNGFTPLHHPFEAPLTKIPMTCCWPPPLSALRRRLWSSLVILCGAGSYRNSMDGTRSTVHAECRIAVKTCMMTFFRQASEQSVEELDFEDLCDVMRRSLLHGVDELPGDPVCHPYGISTDTDWRCPFECCCRLPLIPNLPSAHIASGPHRSSGRRISSSQFESNLACRAPFAF